MHMRCIAIVVGLLAGMHVAVGAARAQESLLPLPLERTSVADALAKSKREHRVLVVVREWKRPPQGRRPWWANDSVRAWIAWHAVLVEVQPKDPEGKLYFGGYPDDRSNMFWGIDVFVDGVRIKLPTCARVFIPDPICPDCYRPAASGPDDWADSGVPCVSPTAVAVLQQLDFQRWCAAERAPLWGQLHELDCPEPKRPGRMYWYAAEEDGIPRTRDAAEPAPGERYVDVASRVAEADAAIASGDSGAALAMLSWLWERGGDVDPAFALARVGVVLPRLNALKAKAPRVGDRVAKLVDAEFALYPWFDDDEEMGYLALRRLSEQAGEVVVRLATENVDLDEETMGAVVGARTGKLKAMVVQMDLDRPVPQKEWGELVHAAREPLPKTTDQQPRERWNRASVELLTIAAVRSYARLLASGDAADHARASQIAMDVIKTAERATAATRAKVLRALVYAAVSVGKAGEPERVWLAEAAKIDPPTEGPASKPLADPLSQAVGVGAK